VTEKLVFKTMRKSLKYILILLLSFFTLSAKDIDTELKKYIIKKSEYVGFIEIGRERQIDQTTYLSIKFALDYFKKKKVSFIILKLNTPGGEVLAASNISRILKEVDTQDGIPIIAFIDDWALSAGAMLAYSSRFIATSDTSSMGAAEPVIMGQSGMERASEKINSALRSEFSNLASFFGRNPDLAEAMVDKDIVLVLRGKEIVRLRSNDEIAKSDIVITPQGKLLTLNSQNLITYGVADLFLKKKAISPISPLEAKAGEWSASKSILFSYPFFKELGEMKIITYNHWKISFFSFLTHPAVVSLLFFIMIICCYIELSSGGFGLFASLSLISLALILLGSFASYTINFLEVIIFCVGILLVLLEVFVIPGFGLTGILGILFTLGGLILFTLPNFSEKIFTSDKLAFSFDFSLLFYRLIWLFSALLASFISIVLLARFIAPKILKNSPLIHKGEQDGYVAGYSKEELPKVNDEALTYSLLRPVGKIIINNKIMDAKAEIGFINKGEEVIISAFDGDKILVRKKR
jgi:membrane-bound serine protease (ClpP class)